MRTGHARLPGDIVKTELRADHERLTYVVKVLTREARVIEVDLDARTGAVQRVEKRGIEPALVGSMALL